MGALGARAHREGHGQSPQLPWPTGHVCDSSVGPATWGGGPYCPTSQKRKLRLGWVCPCPPLHGKARPPRLSSHVQGHAGDTAHPVLSSIPWRAPPPSKPFFLRSRGRPRLRSWWGHLGEGHACPGSCPGATLPGSLPGEGPVWRAGVSVTRVCLAGWGTSHVSTFTPHSDP